MLFRKTFSETQLAYEMEKQGFDIFPLFKTCYRDILPVRCKWHDGCKGKVLRRFGTADEYRSGSHLFKETVMPRKPKQKDDEEKPKKKKPPKKRAKSKKK
jgi:hypothetical protein